MDKKFTVAKQIIKRTANLNRLVFSKDPFFIVLIKIF